MKKLLPTLILLLIIGNLYAEISVKSFRKLENDMTARIDAPKIDQNGDACAIIKVVTTQTGFIWEPDGLGIISAEPKGAEYWLYVPYGAKHITIKHPQLGLLRDYQYPIPIEKATVYEMVLTTGKVITTVEETIDSQWLVITPEPADAAIYIEDTYVKTGVYQAKLKPGSYTYRVEAPLYHTEAGKVEVTDTKKELSIKLNPAFGYISVSSEPEKDAKVIIDGKNLTQNTPCNSEPLASGEHTVQVIKEMYQPSTQKVTVIDGQTTPINLLMQPNFAEITITAPSDADIYINSQKKGTGTWIGRLNPAIYSLEASKDKYRSAKQDIEVIAGDIKTIDLQPTPIYGSLDVTTTPVGASISIDGKEFGTSPITISKLLIGEYNVQLHKEGFANVNKIVTISEGKEAIVSEILPNGKIVSISSNPIGVKLFIDDKEVGITPFNGMLTFGSHAVKAVEGGSKDEKNIDVSLAGENSFDLNLGRYVNVDADIKRCEVYIDDKSVGITPYNGILSLGSHTIRILHDDQKFEKLIVLEKTEGETNFNFEIKKTIRIEKMSGPGNLFLSVLIPGLGDWNVTKREQSGIGKMLWSYGLILSGVGCKFLSDSEYKQYHLATVQTDMDQHYDIANYANYGFYALAATGIAVWVYDIFWVANKGSQNRKKNHGEKLSLIYDPSIHMMGMNYKIKF